MHIVDLPCNVEFFDQLSVIDFYFSEKRHLQKNYLLYEYPSSYIRKLSEMRQLKCNDFQKRMLTDLF